MKFSFLTGLKRPRFVPAEEKLHLLPSPETPGIFLSFYFFLIQFVQLILYDAWSQFRENNGQIRR